MAPKLTDHLGKANRRHVFNQAGLLCHGNKFIRRNKSLLRMFPAHQHLTADNRSAVIVDNRLNIGLELLQFDSLSELILNRIPVAEVVSE